MEELLNTPIGRIVAENYSTWQVFENYKIDYSNKGKKTLKEIADEENLDADSLMKEIQNVAEDTSVADADFNRWDLDKLAEYIVKTYHRPADERILKIRPVLERVAKEHGEVFPELLEINKFFGSVAGWIAMHQKKEEITLFPFIRKMVDADKNNKEFVRPKMTQSAEKPVEMLTHEHSSQFAAFRKIAGMTKEFTSPEGLGADFDETLASLKEMEVKLHKHIHLENNILFPKALALDKTL